MQVGISGLSEPEILERIGSVYEKPIVIYGEKERTNKIFDGVYQTNLLSLADEASEPVLGIVLHPPERTENYHSFIDLLKMMNREIKGFVACENRCNDRYYLTKPFELQYYLDSNLPLWVDVLALFVVCGYSNAELHNVLQHLASIDGNIVGYHFMNMRPVRRGFRATKSIIRGEIDYQLVVEAIDPKCYVTIESRGKRQFERDVKWLKKKAL